MNTKTLLLLTQLPDFIIRKNKKVGSRSWQGRGKAQWKRLTGLKRLKGGILLENDLAQCSQLIAHSL